MTVSGSRIGTETTWIIGELRRANDPILNDDRSPMLVAFEAAHRVADEDILLRRHRVKSVAAAVEALHRYSPCGLPIAQEWLAGRMKDSKAGYPPAVVVSEVDAVPKYHPVPQNSIFDTPPAEPTPKSIQAASGAEMTAANGIANNAASHPGETVYAPNQNPTSEKEMRRSFFKEIDDRNQREGEAADQRRGEAGARTQENFERYAEQQREQAAAAAQARMINAPAQEIDRLNADLQSLRESQEQDEQIRMMQQGGH